MSNEEVVIYVYVCKICTTCLQFLPEYRWLFRWLFNNSVSIETIQSQERKRSSW
jgi:hypothetical protein